MTDYEQDTWAINCPEKIEILKSDAEWILSMMCCQMTLAECDRAERILRNDS